MRETLVKTEDFKDSSVGRIPKDWELVKLGDVLSVLYRYPTYYGIQYVETGIPEIRGELILDNGYLDNRLELYRYISESTASRFHKVRLEPGDFVLSVRGTMGKVAMVTADLKGGVITANLIRLQFNQSLILTQWARHFLLSKIFQDQLDLETSATTIKTIQAPALSSMLLRLPSLQEQEQIAEILNTIDSTIAQTTTLIAKLKQMKAGLLHDLLTRGLDENGKLRDATQHPEQFKDSPLGQIPKDWELLKLESLLNGRPKNGYSPKEVNEWTGTLMLGLGCLTEEGFEPIQLKNAPRNNFKIYTALLSDGDFLLSRSNTRERVALAGIYSDVGVPCIYPDLMMRLSINEKTSNLFLELLLRHSPVRKQLTGNAQGTSGSMVKISSHTVMQTLAALPYLKEQAQIIKCIDTYDRRIRTEEAYRDKLKLQKQGLMHDLLTGKVRVNRIQKIEK